ncbi:helix-turn-helix domain-containing protein [Salmonella enterica]|uniref:helix-turn-helix domain-containing protein n=1 Tax=Salmonella enterica TaxID=28901 RepID=UPI0021D4EC00|nr:helix-turn-helix domain-containing protein [Salmonella enterica]MCU7123644.1 helix-turn-helix domain-containing protein [Salmonella enterica]
MIGLRIKEERERLGLTQQSMADAVGAAKRTVIDWEKDRTSPTAVQLSALSSMGMDVLYIVTGQRAIPVTAPDKVENLSPEKQKLLDAFDNMSADQRRAILEVGRVLTQPCSCKRAG